MRRSLRPSSSLHRWKSFVFDTRCLIVESGQFPILHQTLPSRHLAQVRAEPASELWFNPSIPLRSPADDLLGTPGDGKDHKPPDERTLKLGKSEPIHLLSSTGSTDKCYSTTHPFSPPTEHSHHAFTDRAPLSINLAPPLPFYTSASTRCQRQSTLQGCTLDRASSMGQCANCWQCETQNCLGENRAHRFP